MGKLKGEKKVQNHWFEMINMRVQRDIAIA